MIQELTATGVVRDLGTFVKDVTNQTQQVRYVLPFLLLARLDQKLSPTRKQLIEQIKKGEWDKGKLLDDQSEASLKAMRAKKITGLYFFNLSTWGLGDVPDEHDSHGNLQGYVDGFSFRVRTLLSEHFKIMDQANKLGANLFGFLTRLNKIQESFPEDDASFGLLLRDILQLLTEKTQNNPSDCATPQDVSDLAASLLLATGDHFDGGTRLFYDPAYGTAGLLVTAAVSLRAQYPALNVQLRGCENYPEMSAIGALATLLRIAAFNDEDPAIVKAGEVMGFQKLNSHTKEASRGVPVHYAVCNPPQGSSGEWSLVSGGPGGVKTQAKEEGSRFAVGLPEVTDASFLFIQDILHRLRAGGRAAIVLNGSPLFSGQTRKGGGNEQTIRSWLLENNYLDAVIGLPPNAHFNTDIATYIWVLQKDRPAERRGHVLFIDASGVPQPDGSIPPNCFVEQLVKNLNKKRFSFTADGIERITQMLRDYKTVRLPLVNPRFKKGQLLAKKIPNDDFRFKKVHIFTPNRVRITVHESGMAQFQADTTAPVTKLQKNDPEGYGTLISVLNDHLGYQTTDRSEFRADLKGWLMERGCLKSKTDGRFSSDIFNKLFNAFGDYDPEAEICRNSKGAIEWRDGKDDKIEERIPWNQTTEDYVDKGVRPFVAKQDQAHLHWVPEDEQPGAEFPFTREFYRYMEPRPLADINTEIRDLRKQIDGMLDALDNDLAEVLG